MTFLAESLVTPRACGVRSIRCFTGDALQPDAASNRQLAALAAVEGLDAYVAVLPDVHFKQRNPTPTGTVAVSRSHLVPRAIDPGINCGMRMIATDVPAREFTPPRLDRLFAALIEAIPVAARDTPVLSAADCERLLVEGLAAVAGRIDLPATDLHRIENGGQITPAVDRDLIRAVVGAADAIKWRPWLGTLGAGNHFLELQEITALLDPLLADRLGLRLGDAVVMMHTDSRRLGKRVVKPVFEEAWRTAGNGQGPDTLWTLVAESDLGRRYVAALAAATHAGFANRAVLTSILRTTMRALLGDPTLALPLLYDCAHESIQREEHGGDPVWVHRHGASHAVPPGALPDPVLHETGQPVPIPGSMGAASYIAVAAAGVSATFHSVAHGAGRTLEKVHAAAQFDAAQVESDLGRDGIRLYRYGSDNIAGQAPASFKDAGRVVEAMTAFNLIRPVARLRPVAVLKG